MVSRKTGRLVSGGHAAAADGSDLYGRVRHAMLLVCASTGLVFSLVYGIQVFYSNLMLSFIDFSIGAFCLSVGLWALLRPGRPAQAGILVVASYVFFFFLHTNGGVGGNGALWGLVIPICTLFLLGFRSGLIMTAVYLTATVLVFAGERLLGLPVYRYELWFMQRYWGVYVLSMVVAGAYDRLRIVSIIRIMKETDLRIGAEKELQEKWSMISALLASSPNPVVIFDSAGNCLLYSRSVSLLPGRSEASGSVLEEVYPSVLARSIREKMQDVLAAETPVNWTDHVTAENGEYWFETWIFPIGEGLQGRPLYGAISTDRTGQELSRLQILKSKEEAEEANRAKSRFLASMSHEIRTPLNGVISMTGLLARSELTDEQRRIVSIISSSGETLLSIISDILDFSRIEAGRMNLVLSDFDLPGLLEDLLRLMEPKAVEQTLHLRSKIAPDLPRWLRGSPEKLRQILLNLMGNAVKFTSAGEVEVKADRIAFSDADSRIWIRFSVRDTGIGIPPDKSALLFRRFTQIDGEVFRKYGGAGLGLAIAKELTGLMGGEIGFTSEWGKGSEFFVKIPFGLPEGGAQEVRDHSTTADAGEAISSGPILLVDDTTYSRESVLLLLRSFGCEVESVPGGREALEALKKKRYALVFMDVRMPGMDGLEATRLIRNPLTGLTDPRVAVVALTADAMPETVAACRGAGMDDFLAKPFRMEELRDKVRQWLGHTE